MTADTNKNKATTADTNKTNEATTTSPAVSNLNRNSSISEAAAEGKDSTTITSHNSSNQLELTSTSSDTASATATTTAESSTKEPKETYKHFSMRYDELKWKEAPLHYYSPESEVLPCTSGIPTAGQAKSPSRNNIVTPTSTTNRNVVVNRSATPGAAAAVEQQRDVEDHDVRSNSNPSNNAVMGCPVNAIPQRAPRLPLNGETTALLVVDVQPEYWSNCPMVRQDFPNFPSNLKRTVDLCRERRVKIIWVRADYRRTHSPWLVQFERLRGKDPGFMVEVPCNPEAEDFTWEDFATPMGGEVIIPKSSWSSTSDTALKEVLRVCGIDTVLVCGLITSVCVQHSAFGVFEAGYRTLLVTDACGDRGRARHEAALALYGDYMYELVTSHDLENSQTGIIKAKPVWLTPNTISRRSPDSSSSGVVTGMKSRGSFCAAGAHDRHHPSKGTSGWGGSSNVSGLSVNSSYANSPINGSLDDLRRALPPEVSTASSSSSSGSSLASYHDVNMKGVNVPREQRDYELSTVPTSFSSTDTDEYGLFY